MKIGIYAFRDMKAEYYGNPVYFKARGEAIRQFVDEVNGPKDNSLLAKHPEDFSLYYLGDFDTRSGEVTLTPKPELIGHGSDYIYEKKG